MARFCGFESLDALVDATVRLFACFARLGFVIGMFCCFSYC